MDPALIKASHKAAVLQCQGQGALTPVPTAQFVPNALGSLRVL